MWDDEGNVDKAEGSDRRTSPPDVNGSDELVSARGR